MTKRSLTVLTNESPKTALPEVLPDPRRAPAATGPRQRTLLHMQRLLATAAAMTTAGCGKQDVTNAPTIAADEAGAHPASTTSTAKEDDASAGPIADSNAIDAGPPAYAVIPEAGAAVDGGVVAQPRPPVMPTGYAVVDPMPPPAHCPGIAPLVTPKVAFAAKGAKVEASVQFPLPKGRADYHYTKGAPAIVYGGQHVATSVTATGVTVTALVESTATHVSIAVKGTCNQGPGTLTAFVSWTGAPAPGTTARVNVSEH